MWAGCNARPDAIPCPYSPMRRLSPSAIAHLLLLATVMVWGATFVLIKDALNDATPLLFNLLRMTFAFIVLMAVNHRHLRSLSRRTVVSGAVVGLFLAAGYQFQTSGLARTTPAKSAFITGLVVVFVPLFTAIPTLRPAGSQAPRWTAALGALLALAVCCCSQLPPAQSGVTSSSPSAWATCSRLPAPLPSRDTSSLSPTPRPACPPSNSPRFKSASAPPLCSSPYRSASTPTPPSPRA